MIDFKDLLEAMGKRFYESNDEERYRGAALLPILLPNEEGTIEIHVMAVKDIGGHPDGSAPTVIYRPVESPSGN